MTAAMVTEAGTAFLDRLESLIEFSDGDHNAKLVAMLTVFRDTKRQLSEAFEPFGYPEEVHKTFTLGAMRYEELNPLFLKYGRDKEFLPFARDVRPVIVSARKTLVTELTDYVNLLETTPREYMMATAGLD